MDIRRLRRWQVIKPEYSHIGCKGCGAKATKYCGEHGYQTRTGSKSVGFLTFSAACGLPVCDNCVHVNSTGHYNPVQMALNTRG